MTAADIARLRQQIAIARPRIEAAVQAESWDEVADIARQLGKMEGELRLDAAPASRNLPEELRAFFAARFPDSSRIGDTIADMLDRDTPTAGSEYLDLLSRALAILKRAARLRAKRD